MPFEINLPDSVVLYLMLIERLTTWHNGFDSSSPEHKMYENEVRYYLDLIKIEMTKAVQEAFPDSAEVW